MDIRLTWKGTEYVIPDSRAFVAADALEDLTSLGETYRWIRDPKFAKMAKCMVALLRVAGVTDIDPDTAWREITAQYKRQQPIDFMASVLMLQAILQNGAPEFDVKGKEPEKTSAS